MTPEEALSYYHIQGAVKSIAPFGLGHINDTFKVETTEGAFLLQKVNTNIFKNPEMLEANLTVVLSHAPDLFAEHIQTEQASYHLLAPKACWRLQAFVPNSFGPQTVENKASAFQLGRGFGEFTLAMHGISPELVSEAIPNFHHLGLRIERFKAVYKVNALKRNEQAAELIEKALKYTWIWHAFEKWKEARLPKRICHNDTKSNNLLLDKHSHGFLKVVDLDTIGPGYAMFDYGDMVRSLATHGQEGDRDIIAKPLQVSLIKSNKEGFLSKCGHVLSKEELASLDFGSLFMTYFTAIRMLTDFLEGDVYYRINAWDDNLVRARNQFYVLDLLNDYFEFDGKNG